MKKLTMMFVMFVCFVTGTMTLAGSHDFSIWSKNIEKTRSATACFATASSLASSKSKAKKEAQKKTEKAVKYACNRLKSSCETGCKRRGRYIGTVSLIPSRNQTSYQDAKSDCSGLLGIKATNYQKQLCVCRCTSDR